jgi:hypothetical protein
VARSQSCRTSVRVGGPTNTRQAASDALRCSEMLAPGSHSSFIPHSYPLWVFRWGASKILSRARNPNRLLLPLALSNPGSQAEISSLGAEHYFSIASPCLQQLGTYLSLSTTENTVSSLDQEFSVDTLDCAGPALQCVLHGQVVSYLSLQSSLFEVDGYSPHQPFADPQYSADVLGSLNQRHEFCGGLKL